MGMDPEGLCVSFSDIDVLGAGVMGFWVAIDLFLARTVCSEMGTVHCETLNHDLVQGTLFEKII